MREGRARDRRGPSLYWEICQLAMSTVFKGRSQRKGKGACPAFRCPQREIGKTAAFIISVMSDWHAADPLDNLPPTASFGTKYLKVIENGRNWRRRAIDGLTIRPAGTSQLWSLRLGSPFKLRLIELPVQPATDAISRYIHQRIAD
jgi:hypothetical protein